MKRFENVKYCNKCILNNGDVDTIIGENGLCNICSGGKSTLRHMFMYRNAIENCEQFNNDLAMNKGKYYYDCLLMLSGGKDSIYILYKLITEQIRPLAYTMNHPFESKNAIENMKMVISKLNIEHYEYTPNIRYYKKLMKYAFTKDTSGGDLGNILSYGRSSKFPCLVCSNYIRVCALILAYKMEIPYVVFCADPLQVVSYDTISKNLLIDFMNACGKELYNELPEKKVIDEMLSAGEDRLPKMVFPYAAMNDYNAEKIISELKGLGLYNSSPRETHCSLHPLLNYYSIKRYNTYFYEAELASDVRNGKISRDTVLGFLSAYKDMVLNVMSKRELHEVDKAHIRELLEKIYFLPEMSSQLEHDFNDSLSLRKVADALELDLNEI